MKITELWYKESTQRWKCEFETVTWHPDNWQRWSRLIRKKLRWLEKKTIIFSYFGSFKFEKNCCFSDHLEYSWFLTATTIELHFIDCNVLLKRCTYNFQNQLFQFFATIFNQKVSSFCSSREHEILVCWMNACRQIVCEKWPFQAVRILMVQKCAWLYQKIVKFFAHCIKNNSLMCIVSHYLI